MTHRSLFAGLLAFGAVIAQPLVAADFDFKDSKGVNAVSITMDSMLEPIVGHASGVSGVLAFDPAKPAEIAGTITVDAATLSVSSKGMTEHMLGEAWLDTAQFPTITFTFKSVDKVEVKSETRWILTATGDFTCHGVTKSITVPVDVAFLADKGATRNGPQGKGDLLVMRSNFVVNRAEYGIKPDMGGEKIAQDIEVNFAIVGLNPAK